MNILEKAQYLKKRFDRETWIERKKFFIAKAKAWKKKLKEDDSDLSKQAIKVLEEIK